LNDQCAETAQSSSVVLSKLDALRVSCTQCGHGVYGLSSLINQRGRDAEIIDWLDELTPDCPNKDRAQHERSMRCAVSRFGYGAVTDDHGARDTAGVRSDTRTSDSGFQSAVGEQRSHEILEW
jgi:hypothetical protein